MRVGQIYEPLHADKSGLFEEIGGSFIEIASVTPFGNLSYYILDSEGRRLMKSSGGFSTDDDFIRHDRDLFTTARLSNRQEEPMLRSLTTFLRRTLKKAERNYYRLGWIEVRDNELVVTREGEAAYVHAQMLRDGDIAKFAEEEVARIEEEMEDNE